ncbi:MAG: FKBP-type peptidyl-prolyl cis-trans isomerase [Acidimicrobiales bacterium]
MADKPLVDPHLGAPPDDLVIDDIIVGDGAEALAGKHVVVHYVGVGATSGNEFDSSWNREDPFDFDLGASQVIQGWDRGVEGMRVGGRRRLVIPAHLAYGERGAGGVIGPNETLIFVVDLLDVR